MICYSAMYVQCTFNVRSMHVQCTFNARSMHAHCALVQALLDNSGAFTGSSLSVAHASVRAPPWAENATPLGLEGASRASGRGGIALCAPFERTCACDLTIPTMRGPNPRRFLTVVGNNPAPLARLCLPTLVLPS